jgi:cytokinesis protein
VVRSFRGAPVNLLEVRKGLTELRDGYKRLRKELDEHHADGESSFAKKMWSFSGKAGRQLEDLVDDVNAAEVSFSEVARYYGEDEKNVNSSEFYGIFKTFVTSYSVWASLNAQHAILTLLPQKCQADNRTIADEKQAVEKRRQAAEDLRAARSRTDEPRQEEDTSVLDSLLDKLRKGEVTRRAGHSRRDKRPSPAPLGLDIAQATSGDSAAAALNMLAQLKSDGFSASDSAAALLSATSSSATPRRPRRRPATDEQLALALAEGDGEVEVLSPSLSELPDEEVDELDEPDPDMTLLAPPT